MQMLAGAAYDPATLQTPSTAAALALTALDTTNLRLNFTAPANGVVYCKLRSCCGGASTYPQVMLGILDGATVKGRVAAYSFARTSATSQRPQCNGYFTVGGLTPGNSYTWDAAYGVETGVASSTLMYGGPDDATATNATGAFEFEIWDTPGLLAGVNYDPAILVNGMAFTVRKLTAIDTANARLTFTAPASGNVYAAMRIPAGGGTTVGMPLFGILESTTIRASFKPNQSQNNTTVTAADLYVCQGGSLITGLTPGNSYTWDAALGIESAGTSMTVNYGGPNNSTAGDAWGGLGFTIWNAADVPRELLMLA